MRKRISSQTCAKSIRYLNKIAAVTHTLIHTCEQLKYACLFEWLYDRKEVVCPIYLTPYLLVFTGPRKTRLSMLFADALKTIGATKKDYTRTPHVWQGLFHGQPLLNAPVYRISLPHSMKIA
jgi:hypothetical protein